MVIIPSIKYVENFVPENRINEKQFLELLRTNKGAVTIIESTELLNSERVRVIDVFTDRR